MTSKYVSWGDSKVKLTWKRDSQLPPRSLITSVHGFCFKGEKLLLVKLNHRGWDFPGGHIELEESPEECLKRETYEEAYITGSTTLLGHIIVDHHENLKWDTSSIYPKVGYQVFYRIDIELMHAFQAQFESAERILINTREVIEYYHDWNELYQEILECALDLK
ncbi:NUDIX domain-containing protein [Psychrobacillus psychrotolerans]|uniref:NUDIX domain-containing protein n=1 Tax=Psychrobacillus psychrotolerans TaxID=126156 RepID=A0A1I5V1R9_9BACI|nr:NUDIX domain-containing protein [Psychrobacillus psychrotolerans]SFQ01428.1 NUDIX domain-containing protein [Psychrobacillus psychrotolerans]